MCHITLIPKLSGVGTFVFVSPRLHASVRSAIFYERNEIKGKTINWSAVFFFLGCLGYGKKQPR